MPSQVGLAESRRSRVNVSGAPRETLVTNVGGFRIPNRLLKSVPYLVFRIAAVGYSACKSHHGAAIEAIARMAFRLEFSASFDYFNNQFPDFPRLVARTSCSSSVLFRSRKIADVTDQFN
jgi:hypothetical protein